MLRSFPIAFDAFPHLPDLNVRPTQIYNICLKIKKKEKYVCNEIRFPECTVAAYLSIFQGCNIEKTTNKIPFISK